MRRMSLGYHGPRSPEMRRRERISPTNVSHNYESKRGVGFLSTAFATFGGTETFHRTLIPRLRSIVEVAGFVATGFSGGDGQSLGVPYSTGLESARNLAANTQVIVTWGISDLRTILPADRPRVIAVHHSDWSSEWSNRTITSQSDLIDEIVCVNADAAVQLARRIKNPVHYIPNAVDPGRIITSGRQTELRAEFGIAADSKIVLYGHRLSAEKRPALAVEIARLLPENWTLVIAGDGPEHRIVEQLASDTDRVRVVGHCVNLADWLSISDCFLSLSTFEGFGLSVCEALMAGIPVVSTHVGIAPGLAMTLPIESKAIEWAAAIENSHQVVTPETISSFFGVERMVSDWHATITNLSARRII